MTRGKQLKKEERRRNKMSYSNISSNNASTGVVLYSQNIPFRFRTFI